MSGPDDDLLNGDPDPGDSDDGLGAADDGAGADTSAQETDADREARAAREDEARKYGWKAASEFDRAPKSWVDADRYLELPATHIKMLRDENKAMAERLAAAERASTEGVTRAEAVARATADRLRQTETARFEQEQQRIATAKREAAAAGDLPRYQQIETYERSLTRPDFTAEPARPEAAVSPETQEFLARNPWTQNPVLMEQARLAVERMPGGFANHTPAQQLAYAEGQIRQVYPHLFAAQTTTQAATTTAAPSRVDGGGLGTGARRGKSAADLPADVRREGEIFVRDGTFKTLDEYARAYYEDTPR